MQESSESEIVEKSKSGDGVFGLRKRRVVRVPQAARETRKLNDEEQETDDETTPFKTPVLPPVTQLFRPTAKACVPLSLNHSGQVSKVISEEEDSEVSLRRREKVLVEEMFF